MMKVDIRVAIVQNVPILIFFVSSTKGTSDGSEWYIPPLQALEGEDGALAEHLHALFSTPDEERMPFIRRLSGATQH